METMITVNRAMDLLKEHVLPLLPIPLSLNHANGLVVAEDIYSTLDIPAFPQSSMDGYAFLFHEDHNTYSLTGEVAAGSPTNHTLQKGEAVRIFTGAAVPVGADTVLMQEKASVENGILTVQDPALTKGSNVRSVGAEIAKGQLALKKGTLLNPAAIGFLASIGLSKVKAYPKPAVGILVTGNELQQPGNPLLFGQVYESNSYSLSAVLQELQMKDIKIIQSPDNLQELSKHLMKLLEECDVVLVTGGVSVGDYDFTLKAFENCGIECIFHKIKQKPGKPLLMGKKGSKIAFGLPGNPASVLTCFYEYVLPALGHLMQQNKSLKELKVPLVQDFKKPEGLTHFLKAQYNGSEVSIQTGQESYKLSSYASANCLAVLPEQTQEISKGSLITIHLLPHFQP